MLSRASKLNATVLNKENKVSILASVVDFLIVLVIGGGSAGADLYEQAMSVNLIMQKCR